MIDAFYGFGNGLIDASWWTGVGWPVTWALVKIVAVVLPLMGAVAYLTLWERKAIGFTQVRPGPARPRAVRIDKKAPDTWPGAERGACTPEETPPGATHETLKSLARARPGVTRGGQGIA